jgi:hypothetical protein
MKEFIPSFMRKNTIQITTPLIIRFIAMVLLIPLSLNAQYKYTTANGNIVITRYTGSDTNIVIPSIMFNAPVTMIGDGAFASCKRPTTIMIPDSITHISTFAFSGCHLTAVDVDMTNTVYSSKDGVLFNKSQTVLVHYPKWKTNDSYEIPGTVKCIEKVAFDTCTNLTQISIPDSVTEIGPSAFSSCSKLKSISIPSSVTLIGERAFQANSLPAITVDGNNAFYSSVEGVLFNKDKTALIRFPSDKATEKYAIPESVTSIEPHAFDNCLKLTDITMPGSVTNIGSAAFIWCRNLASLTVSSRITSIGEMAFAECTSLSNISLPTNVTTIAMGTFFGCKSLRNVIIPDRVTCIGGRAFYDCRSMSDIVIPGGVTNIGEWAFAFCSGLTNIVILSSIERIETGTFSECRNLVSITLPESITRIKKLAFYRCWGLGNITIPAKVNEIGEKVFEECQNLRRVLFQGNAPEVGTEVFNKADNATVYYLPGTTGWTQTFGERTVLPWKQ